jgi:prepilin-type processing-associated H-X9-DG protein
MYSLDYNGWCATIIAGGGDTCVNAHWYNNPSLMGYLGWHTGTEVADSSKSPLSIRLCPSDSAPWTGGSPYKITSYGGNFILGAGSTVIGSSIISQKNMRTVNQPSKTLEFCDATDFYVSPYANYFSDRHKGFMNIVYLDGHSDGMRPILVPMLSSDVFWGK